MNLECPFLQLLMLKSLKLCPPHFQQLIRRTHLNLAPLMLVAPGLDAFTKLGSTKAEFDAVVEPAGGVVSSGGEGVASEWAGVGSGEGGCEGDAG